jgi:hypothetical protein
MDLKTQKIFDTIYNNDTLKAGIKSAFDEAVQHAGDASFTRFMNAVKAVASDELKGSISRASVSASGTSWRSDIKSEFTGRGRQWFYVSIEDIDPVLDKFDNDGFDTSSYRNDINNAGKAWVRFAGVSGSESNPQLKVEVRINGSKIDHPQNRVNMPYSEDIDRLEDGKTPYALGLEGAKSKPATKKNDNAEKNVVIQEEPDVDIQASQDDDTTNDIVYNAEEVASEIPDTDFDIEAAFSELDELANSIDEDY